MPLNSSGPISMGGSTVGQSINLELGRSSTASINLNEATVRDLAGVASGAIVLPTDFYGADFTGFGFIGRGYNTSSFAITADVSKVTIATTGNAVDYGNLLAADIKYNATGNATRAVFAGGDGTNGAPLNRIQYKSWDSSGNFSDFGDLTNGELELGGANANSTYALFTHTSGTRNKVDLITIASTGNSTDFATLYTTTNGPTASFQSSTRAVSAGGGIGPASFNVIEYGSFTSGGSWTDFGDCSAANIQLAGCGSSTRGLILPGKNDTTGFTNRVDYVTIASTGNSVDFGDMIAPLLGHSALSSETRAITGSGYNNNISGYNNVLSYRTISSLGNFLDFGDLPYTGREGAGASDSHGGIT